MARAEVWSGKVSIDITHDRNDLARQSRNRRDPPAKCSASVCGVGAMKPASCFFCPLRSCLRGRINLRAPSGGFIAKVTFAKGGAMEGDGTGSGICAPTGAILGMNATGASIWRSLIQGRGDPGGRNALSRMTSVHSGTNERNNVATSLYNRYHFTLFWINRGQS